MFKMSLKDIIGFKKRKWVIAPEFIEGEESPDTTRLGRGKAYGLTTRRGINNARGANSDAIARKG